jgi:carbamoyltransferase
VGQQLNQWAGGLFRTFARVVLRGRLLEYFDRFGRSTSILILGSSITGHGFLDRLLVGNVKQDRHVSMSDTQKALCGIEKHNVLQSEIPPCTHVNDSVPAQAIAQNSYPAYYRLIKAFESKMGVPVLLNTSFNVRGEPILCVFEDTINGFLGTAMGAVVVKNIRALKADISAAVVLDYKHQLQLD